MNYNFDSNTPSLGYQYQNQPGSSPNFGNYQTIAQPQNYPPNNQPQNPPSVYLQEYKNQYNIQYTNQNSYSAQNNPQNNFPNSFQNLNQNTNLKYPNQPQLFEYAQIPGNIQKPEIYPNPLYSQTQEYPQQGSFNSNQGKYPQNIDLYPLKNYFNIFAHGSYQNNRNILQSTINLLPKSRKTFESLSVPFGLIYTPFTKNIPIINIPYKNFVRCRSCASYINPYIKIIDEYNYICSICHRKNSIRPDSNSYDVSLTNRPELKYSVFEYDSELSVREAPQSLAIVVLLDISTMNDSSFFLETFAQTLKATLSKIPGGKRSSMAFVAFDSFIHIYNVVSLRNKNSNNSTDKNDENIDFRIEHSVITDLDEPFFISHDSEFFRFKTDRRFSFLLDNLLEVVKSTSSAFINNKFSDKPHAYGQNLPFSENNRPQSCLGSALDYASKLLHKTGGGLIVSFLFSPPTLGLKAYNPRNPQPFSTGKQEESVFLTASTDEYREFGMKTLENNITIDLFSFASETIDIANLVPMCQITGGDVYVGPSLAKSPFEAKIWLAKNLEVYFLRSLRLNNSIKIRMHSCFEVHGFFGHFFTNSFSKFAIPVMSEFSTMALHVMMVSCPPKEFPYNCFQFSVLSTSSDGIPRLRVVTLCLNHTDNIESIFQSINFPCFVGLISRMAVERALNSCISDTKSAICNALVDMIKSYSAKRFENNSSFNMNIPIAIYQTAVLLFCLHKNDCFSLYKNIKIDKRVQRIISLRSQPIDYQIAILFPVLYCLSDLLQCASFQEPYFINNYMCYSIPSSYESLQSDKVYILDSGIDIHIYITANVPNKIVKNLLGVESVELMPDVMITLPTLNNEINKFVIDFINLVSNCRPYKPNIVIFNDSCTVMRDKFCSLLKFDNTDKNGSFRDWIKVIRSKLLDSSE